ncbi:META domain-containing protein [Chryseobacterium sp. PBS4-4]|uniref:META domain-containing protein n=1 Tax=Chryseobacterium edaphi TaxID=2976532 RepID=A0ABT2W8R9_9FLAO|nr:META domain-containing protein [Chryseobacterium edaphi]MCU7618586.1 META domain-containing protein [Chryseobacterium edaphi]
MKKLIFTLIIIAVSFVTSANAQTNSLAKSTWQVEKINSDGSVFFKKAKTIKFPAEQPKINFLQFESDKNYHTGNTCFHMMGKYSEYENNQVEISEGAADMVENCEEPKTFNGLYNFKIDKDRLELIPVKE